MYRGYYTSERQSKPRQFSRSKAYRAQRREQPYDALKHLKTQTQAMRVASPTNSWFETIAVFKTDSENPAVIDGVGAAQYRELVLRTSLALGTVRTLLPLVNQAHDKLKTTEEHLQVAVLISYIIEFAETQIRFGPIYKDCGYNHGQLSADYICSLLKEPGLNMPPVQPIANGCTYALINDLDQSIKRSHRDYAAVWLPVVPSATGNWAIQVEESLNGASSAPRTKEGVEECLERLRSMTEVASVMELFPFSWLNAQMSQKKIQLTPDTLVGVTGRPLKIFLGKRILQFISSRYARVLSYDNPDLPLPGFARENTNFCFWPTIGLMRAEMESQARTDLRSDEVLHVTNAREQAGLYPKGSFVIREAAGEKVADNPDAGAANMDKMIKKAVQAQIQTIMSTPGGAQRFMREHGIEKKPRNSAASAPYQPPVEVILTSEDEGSSDNVLRHLQDVSPPVQAVPPIPVPASYNLQLLPANEGPQFTVSGMSASAIQFLNPSQLPPLTQGAPVTVANTVTSCSSSRNSSHPVPILPAPPKAKTTPTVGGAEKKKKGSEGSKHRSDRSTSRSRKNQANSVAGPAHDSSRNGSREFPALSQPAHPAGQSAATPVKVTKEKRGAAPVCKPINTVEQPQPTNQTSVDIRVEDQPNSGYSQLLDELASISKIPK